MKAKVSSPTSQPCGALPKGRLLQFPATASTGTFERSALLDTILRQVREAIVVSDRNRNITLVNTAARRLAQIEPEGRSLRMAPAIWGRMFDRDGNCVPAKDWPWMKALRGKTTVLEECHLVRADGTSSDALFSAAPLKATGHEIAGMVASLVDITKHKRAELLLRGQCVDRERSRIAADIHDTLSQGLNAIVLQLKAAAEDVPGQYKEAHRHLRLAHDTARDSLAQARRSMWTFSQESVDGEDLTTSLSSVAERLFSATAIKLQLSLQPSPGVVPQEIRCALMRIGNEALCNVLKHARATRVEVQLAYTGQQVELRVLDNGAGFVTSTNSRRHQGLGLASMHERAQRLGGNVVIDSQPGQGTRILALIPLGPLVSANAA